MVVVGEGGGQRSQKTRDKSCGALSLPETWKAGVTFFIIRQSCGPCGTLPVVIDSR